MPEALAGKVAVITGGAGGIGGAICARLAHAHCRLAIGYHQSAAKAQALAQSLPGPGHAAIALPVTDSAALRAGAAQVKHEFGRCDILINCAGITRFVPHPDLDALDDAIIDQILAVNVRGAFAAVRAFRALLTESGAGLVVNISSIAARTAMGSNIMYCASKAALDNMTLSLARALAPAIRVVSVAPGLVDTEFVRSLDKNWRDEQAARTPLRRLATPEEVAAAVLATATHLTFSTGTIFAVDGGRPLA